MERILDCPFCKQQAVLMRDPLWHGNRGYLGEYEIYVECTNEFCNVSLPYGKFNTIGVKENDAKEKAIKKWNYRGE